MIYTNDGGDNMEFEVLAEVSKVTNVKYVIKMDAEGNAYQIAQDPTRATHIAIEFDGNKVVFIKKEEGNNVYLLADALSD